MARFEWDPKKAAENLVRHGVTFESAVGVFADPYALTTFDDDHSEREARQTRLGRSMRKVLLVVFTERKGSILRLISARRATKNERRRYEESKGVRHF